MKIFGIGLNKTGTKTLGSCLKYFGYKHTSYDLDALRYFVNKDWDYLFSIIDQYDSFEDWPWPLMYKQLDEKYPGSTEGRTPEIWFESLRKHAIRTGPTEFRLLVYGHEMPMQNKEAHLKIYNDHNRNVMDYFKDKRDKFIKVCWEKGDSWEELCRFLDINIPEIPFPHANRSPY